MKLDYKPKTTFLKGTTKSTSLYTKLFRQMAYALLGISSIFCLSMAITPHHSPIVKEAVAIPFVKSDQKQEARANATDVTHQHAHHTEHLISRLHDDITHWQTVTVKAGDTLAKIFTRLGLSAKDLQAIIDSNNTGHQLSDLQPGQTLKLFVTPQKEVQKLSLEIAPGNTLHIARDLLKHETGTTPTHHYQAAHKKEPLHTHLAFGKGIIHSSLSLAGKSAGLDKKVIGQLIDIFGSNIDFALDLRPQDSFRVLYEEKTLDGKKVESGQILVAEIINDGHRYQAIRYTDPSGNTGYFSADGYSLNQMFLRTPVNFTHISSHFGQRHHPIMHKMHKHKGVDYAAPIGTEVHSTADGRISYIGPRKGYGKCIEVQHGSRYSTFYAHLSRFAKGLKVNSEVHQGQVIGYVGQTGLATGPHLHYEFKIDKVWRNPETVALPKTNPLNNKAKHQFIAHAKDMLKLLNTHDDLQMAKVDYKYTLHD